MKVANCFQKLALNSFFHYQIRRKGIKRIELANIIIGIVLIFLVLIQYFIQKEISLADGLVVCFLYAITLICTTINEGIGDSRLDIITKIIVNILIIWGPILFTLWYIFSHFDNLSLLAKIIGFSVLTVNVLIDVYLGLVRYGAEITARHEISFTPYKYSGRLEDL